MLRRMRQRSLTTDIARYLFSRAGKIVSGCLTSSIVAISIALIAYISACLAWVEHWRSVDNDAVTLSFNNYSQSTGMVNGTWTNDVHYNVRALNLDDIYAMLVAGILGTATGLLLLAMLLCMRQERMCELKMSRKKPALKLELTTILDAALALGLLIAAVIVWIRHDQVWSGPRTDWLPDHHVNRTSNVGPRGDRTTFESWNCGLSWNTYSYASRLQTHRQLREQCRHATTSRRLMVPLVALALFRLSLRPLSVAVNLMSQQVREFLQWKRHTKQIREGRGTELDQMRAKRERDVRSATEETDSVKELAETNVEIAELPGWRMSRGEMEGDAALTEMTGTEGGKEMDAGVAAVEKDASEGHGHKT